MLLITILIENITSRYHFYGHIMSFLYLSMRVDYLRKAVEDSC